MKSNEEGIFEMTPYRSNPKLVAFIELTTSLITHNRLLCPAKDLK